MRTVTFPQDQKPQLLVVVDTEEEFDWSAPASRSATGVTAMANVHRAQSICDEYGLRPCYVIDYPVASQPDGYAPLVDIHRRGGCVIGTHLHPWVNPPFDEPLCPRNTYPGNLPAALERRKLEVLTETIRANLGVEPAIYKAGRYGIGPNTPEALEALGYRIDLSVCPAFDYRADGGPDFRDAPAVPYWFGSGGGLLEIPVTGGFVGWLGQARKAAYSLASRFVRLRAPGILSRLAAVDRLMLSPEGFSTDEHIALTRALLARGVRTFTWSFHSPSVQPGMTPYVANNAQLTEFLDRFRRYFDFFFGELGGVPTTPNELRAYVETIG